MGKETGPMNYSIEWDGPGEREATHVECRVQPGSTEQDFAPFPGSEAAIAAGCICPVQRRWPHTLRFSVDCPLHELERVAN
jgi:hypothetical protein